MMDVPYSVMMDVPYSPLTTQEKERSAGEHAKRAGELALQSKDALALSRKYFTVSRAILMHS